MAEIIKAPLCRACRDFLQESGMVQSVGEYGKKPEPCWWCRKKRHCTACTVKVGKEEAHGTHETAEQT